MTDDIDVAVIGAGVVGLAVARQLARQGRAVAILEAEGAVGTGISSRSSEVIHAGLYYPRDSLKAKLCVAGRRLLYAYAAERGVAHRKIGKLVVANGEGDLRLLAEVEAKARANGVEGLERIDAQTARAMEPKLRCDGALLSPETGILDSHGLMLALLADAEAAGALLALKSPVQRGRVAETGIELDIGGADPSTLRAKWVINAAGLSAWSVARAIAGVPTASLPPRYLCKGNYFQLSGKMPFSRLVYPVPGHAGLGVHFTLDLAGQGRFGPDTEWIERVDYAVDERRGESFYGAIRDYWPDLPDGALRPGHAGIRPKISGPDDPAADFRIDGPKDHGVPGWVALYGIESPGLTSCLAIADHVAGLAGE
ncbi:MAG: NAD(P)/FAD-dependent oxidoreductase [Rhodospirillales bacterium]|nr:NAD(P)/FAD-dependent oxidoreductase [Rhodospirillales bacterium]